MVGDRSMILAVARSHQPCPSPLRSCGAPSDRSCSSRNQIGAIARIHDGGRRRELSLPVWAVNRKRRTTADRPSSSTKKKPRATAGLKLLGVDSMMGRTGLRPNPQRLSQVPVWIVTHAEGPPRFWGRPSSSAIGVKGRAQRIRAAAHPPPSSVATAHLANVSA
jgi:hypothetical protein